MTEGDNPAKILVVDDEPDLELLISQKFRKKVREKELHFIFAHNGLEALKILEHDDIDMVLTDINMPEMDGLTLVSKLNSEYPYLKSVIISAYGDMGNIRKALNFGAFDFLTKPIDFKDLEITIQKTVQEVLTLKQAVLDREQLSALEQELSIAHSIQRSMIPKSFPAYPDRKEFEIHADLLPTREVGGDFYDYFFIDDYHLYFVIGDVSGKGVAAALFMAVCRTLLRAVALKGLPPNGCLEQVDTMLNLENESCMFATVFCGVLKTFTGEVVYCNGGHELPYLLKKDGALLELENTEGKALGTVREDVKYKAQNVMLLPGDALFLYTDGITDAIDSSGTIYSDERLKKLLKQKNGMTTSDLVNEVMNEIKNYSAGTIQSDDVAALAIKFLK